MPRVPAEKRDQQDGGARRKEGSRGLPRVPAEKRDQQDRVGKKERETKRIAKGTRRIEGLEGERDQGDCLGYQQKEKPGGWRGSAGWKARRRQGS